MSKSSQRNRSVFPYKFEKNGRVGTIYKLRNGTFKTYFRHGGAARQNTHATAESALRYLEKTFKTLDTDRENTKALHPLDSPIRVYSELEQVLKREGDGATLRDAVSFYIAHHRTKKLQPKTVGECAEIYVRHQRANNLSPSQISNLEKHFRRFKRDFADSKIHSLTSLEISNWLGSRTAEMTGNPWSAKTRT